MRYKSRIKPLNYLSEEQMELVHKKTLHLLEDMGLKVYNARLREKLRKAGAKVEGEVVRFGKCDLEDALSSAKSEFILYGTDASKNVTVNKHNMLVESYSNALKYFDSGKNVLRDSSYEDLVNFTRLCEALDFIDIIGPGCVPTDVKKENQILIMAGGLLANTTKPSSIAPQNVDELRLLMEMNEIVNGLPNSKDRPRFSITVSPTSPFQLDYDSSETLMFSAENSLPVLAAPCPMGGGTSPFTLAGTILLTNVESLFLLICTQMLNPGNPFIKGGASCAMDLRNASVAYGSAERNLLIGANGQLAYWYNLPGSTPGSSVDAWTTDEQMGLQKMHVFLTRILGYGNYCVAAGSVYNGIAISCEQAVVDIEMVKIAIRIAEGINFDDDALAVDVIKSVGHGGNYLTDEHTLKWLETGKEHVYIDLINIDGPAGKSMLERAGEKVREILKKSKPVLNDKVMEEVDRYINNRLR